MTKEERIRAARIRQAQARQAEAKKTEAVPVTAGPIIPRADDGTVTVQPKKASVPLRQQMSQEGRDLLNRQQQV